ncbi:hypothetical protein CORC01_10339 [Colletotrichum orchidophilum]|uniref:Uncharacterized protein n=1 Tax=Colletotrichum orchidophilum TaxID=1209926 RepID=A0A1G4AZ58_9PEZI|nr:uncharacterized protein CORC01_10339 [Colletotrichum orchidophilum]OHE94411.1 hypothetical protein CORC01_10339 [Colletotrichum orchidophilum]
MAPVGAFSTAWHSSRATNVCALIRPVALIASLRYRTKRDRRWDDLCIYNTLLNHI